jgi:alcohol dehydrogenase class IV
LADALKELLLSLGVPTSLSACELKEEQALALTHEMFTPGRADNNLRPASVDEVHAIVRDAFQCNSSLKNEREE